MNKLSVVIITLNEEDNIAKCLDSVKPVADEIVVVDSFSTDQTETICETYDSVKFIKNRFVNYGLQKQFAIEQASFNLILSIDADEYLSDELTKEIHTIKGKELQYAGYFIRRKTIYLGKMLNFCGMNTEKHLRLFDKTKGAFNDAKVHEKFITDGKCTILKHKFVHHPYRDLDHQQAKYNQYSTLFAEGKAGKKRCTRCKVVTKSFISFLLVYFVKFSFLDGYAGYVWSKMSAHYSFMKYAKLYEKNKTSIKTNTPAPAK
ncbi:MAG: glycosyltransferase family 2 protein [Bacteroidales bacterium]